MPNAIGMRANARTSMTAKPIRDSAMDQVPADGHGGRRARRARQSRTAAVVPAIAAIRVATGAIGVRKRVVSGKGVSVRVDLGGRRIIKKKNTQKKQHKRR